MINLVIVLMILNGLKKSDRNNNYFFFLFWYVLYIQYIYVCLVFILFYNKFHYKNSTRWVVGI